MSKICPICMWMSEVDLRVLACNRCGLPVSLFDGSRSQIDAYVDEVVLQDPNTWSLIFAYPECSETLGRVR